MRVSIRRFEDPAAFRRRSEPWLLRREAEHNLLLGLLRTLETSPQLFQAPIYLAAVELAGEVVGCAFRTPPFKLGLTRMPPEALPPLVEDVAGAYADLPAVLGPRPQALRFAEIWCVRAGGEPREGMHQRIFQLDQLVPPSDPAPGRLRVAGEDDLELVMRWVGAFAEDATVTLPDARRLARERVENGAAFLWEDGEPVSMAGYGGETPNGMRIGFVYTPPPAQRARVRHGLRGGPQPADAGRGQALLLPLHGPGEPDLEPHLRADRLPPGGRRDRRAPGRRGPVARPATRTRRQPKARIGPASARARPSAGPQPSRAGVPTFGRAAGHDPETPQ